jgi:hypothetical protein
MIFSRGGHTATLLPNGTVLLAGGYGYAGIGAYSGTLSTAEIYTPAVPAPAGIVSELRFDLSNVSGGDSFTADFSGSNLTSEMFFDVRFLAPGSTMPAAGLNWQKGATSAHAISAGIAPGVWIITGVRAHRFESDHSGPFLPVTATITVSR